MWTFMFIADHLRKHGDAKGLFPKLYSANCAQDKHLFSFPNCSNFLTATQQEGSKPGDRAYDSSSVEASETTAATESISSLMVAHDLDNQALFRAVTCGKDGDERSSATIVEAKPKPSAGTTAAFGAEKLLRSLEKLDMYSSSRCMAVTEFTKQASSAGMTKPASTKIAIIHEIRSVMLVEIHGKDRQTGGGVHIMLPSHTKLPNRSVRV